MFMFDFCALTCDYRFVVTILKTVRVSFIMSD